MKEDDTEINVNSEMWTLVNRSKTLNKAPEFTSDEDVRIFRCGDESYTLTIEDET